MWNMHNEPWSWTSSCLCGPSGWRQPVRPDVMLCSTGSEGHLVLFVPLDMRGCHTKKAHLCTDMCYTLTPVMQTAHNSSCNTFLTAQESLTHRWTRDKIKTEMQWSNSATSLLLLTSNTGCGGFIALGVVKSKVFVDSVTLLIAWISTLQQGVGWNPFVSSDSFLWLQRPVILSH